MAHEVRELRSDELHAAWDLGRLAFGYRLEGGEPPAAVVEENPALTRLGAFDPSGRLVAKATDRHYRQSYGGAWVTAAGVGGVVVAPEQRGRGTGRAVLTALVHEARERGAAVSPLFPSTPAVYRALGWEVAGSKALYRVPALALTALRPPPDVEVRPAEENDVPGIRAVYRAVASETDGLLDRDGPLFATDPAELLRDPHGYTVACGREGEVEGYASWERGPGSDAAARVTVPDLLALTPRASAGLLAVLGSWAPVAPALVLRLLDADAAALPVPVTAVERQDRWMLRVLDAERAIAQRGWPRGVRLAVDLDLVDPLVPEHAGPHRLVVEDGRGTWEPGGSGAVRLHVRGLSALYGGGHTAAGLRRLGLVEGNPSAGAALDLLLGRPRAQLLDHF